VLSGGADDDLALVGDVKFMADFAVAVRDHVGRVGIDAKPAVISMSRPVSSLTSRMTH
jgi:hypothetical protein